MPLQYINELLELPELQLQTMISITTKEVHIGASPVATKQPCPICGLEQHVKRDGQNKPRTIRHLSVFGRKCYLHVPTQRLACNHCQISFVWAYEFAGSKQRYSYLFRTQTVDRALSSTAAHSARMQDVPASTVQHMHQEALPIISERLAEQA